MNPLIPILALVGGGLALSMLALAGRGSEGGQAIAVQLPSPAQTTLDFVEVRTGTGLGPVVVALHGKGGSPEALAEAIKHAKFPAIWILPRGPLKEGKGFAWYPSRYKDGEQKWTRDLLYAAAKFDQFLAAFPGKVMLAGHSQGGALALTTGLLYPDRVSGVVAASAYTGNFLQSGVRTPVVLVHGLKDSIIPITENQGRFAGREGVKLVKVPRAGHDLKGHLLVAWLNSIYGLGQILMSRGGFSAPPQPSPAGGMLPGPTGGILPVNFGPGGPLVPSLTPALQSPPNQSAAINAVLPKYGVHNFDAQEFLTLRSVGQLAKLPAAYVPNMIRVLQLAQALRTKLGVPLEITSGYRPPAYNKKVGGAQDSAHLRGAAADIVLDSRYVSPKRARRLQVEAAKGWLKLPDFIAGLGIYDSGRGRVHVDVKHPGGRGRRTWGTGDVKGVIEQARRELGMTVGAAHPLAPAYGVPATIGDDC